MTRKVVVLDYDPTWPTTFDNLRMPIAAALRGTALSIEHVGSTSVPGLAAKPIIDLDVVVASRAELPLAIERLSALGYVHQGNLGVEDREAFKAPPDLPSHHLYVCVQGSLALENHLAVRESLRRDPAAVVRYSELKKGLAEQYPTDIASYTEGKTGFLVSILAAAGFCEANLRNIRDVNRK